MTGTHDGSIVINIDDVGSFYSGVGYIVPNNTALPSSVAFFNTKDKGETNKFKASIYPIDPRSHYQCEWEQIKDIYPGVTHSKEAEVTTRFKDNELHLEAKTDIGTIVESSIIGRPGDIIKSSV